MLKIRQIGNEYIISFFNVKRFNTVICEKVKGYLMQFVNGPQTRLKLNLNGVEFIDSCGFDTLLSVLNTAEKNGGSLQFFNVSDDVKELIELLHLTDKFDIVKAKN